MTSRLLAATLLGLLPVAHIPAVGSSADYWSSTESVPYATLEVYCPPDAQITINGEATRSKGMHRVFRSPMPNADLVQRREYYVEATLRRKGNQGQGQEGARKLSREAVLQPGSRETLVFAGAAFFSQRGGASSKFYTETAPAPPPAGKNAVDQTDALSKLKERFNNLERQVDRLENQLGSLRAGTFCFADDRHRLSFMRGVRVSGVADRVSSESQFGLRPQLRSRAQLKLPN